MNVGTVSNYRVGLVVWCTPSVEQVFAAVVVGYFASGAEHHHYS